MNEAADATGDVLDTSDDAGPWLSVGEAEKGLGMSERHVRRMTNRLSDHDRTRTHGGPLRVRLDALERLRDEGPAQNVRPDTDAPDTDNAPPATGHGQRPDVDTMPASEPQTVSRSAGDAELIEQLRAENGRLWASLEQANANTAAALSQLDAARRESQTLLGAVASNRLQINAATSAEPETETESSAAKGQLQEARTENGDKSEDKPVGFWARLWKAGR